MSAGDADTAQHDHPKQRLDESADAESRLFADNAESGKQSGNNAEHCWNESVGHALPAVGCAGRQHAATVSS